MASETVAQPGSTGIGAAASASPSRTGVPGETMNFAGLDDLGDLARGGDRAGADDRLGHGFRDRSDSIERHRRARVAYDDQQPGRDERAREQEVRVWPG